MIFIYLYAYMQVQWWSIKIIDEPDLACRPPFEEPCFKSFDQQILELTCQQFLYEFPACVFL